MFASGTLVSPPPLVADLPNGPLPKFDYMYNWDNTMSLDTKIAILSLHHILIIDVGLTTSNDQRLPNDAPQPYPSFDPTCPIT